jgi:hypothetical protein
MLGLPVDFDADLVPHVFFSSECFNRSRGCRLDTKSLWRKCHGLRSVTTADPEKNVVFI